MIRIFIEADTNNKNEIINYDNNKDNKDINDDVNYSARLHNLTPDSICIPSFVVDRKDEYNIEDTDTETYNIYEKIINIIDKTQIEQAAKEDLYLYTKFRPAATRWVSDNKANEYVEMIKAIPRYWLKNPDALTIALEMLEKLQRGPMTVKILERYYWKVNQFVLIFKNFSSCDTSFL